MQGLGGELPDRVGNYLVTKTYAPGDDPWVVRHAWLGDVLSRHASRDIAIKEATRLWAADDPRSRRRFAKLEDEGNCGAVNRVAWGDYCGRTFARRSSTAKRDHAVM
jgi:hypothetical protein